MHWFEICHHLKIFSDHLSVTIWNYFISHISCFNLKSFHTTNQSPYEKLSNRNSFWEAFINFQTTYQSPLEKLSNGDHSDGDDQRGITSLDEIASLNAESTDIHALCKKTSIRLTLRTLGPDSWDLAVAWGLASRKLQNRGCHEHQQIAVTQSAPLLKTVVWSPPTNRGPALSPRPYYTSIKTRQFFFVLYSF